MAWKGEVSKAHSRRVREGWFEKYAPEGKIGIDIGAGNDPLNKTFRRWDLKFGDGDATLMKGVPNNLYHTVHASHVLEHLDNPTIAVKNWYRILAPKGNLIILVPHRDLYEKKKELPSRWNHSHKSLWLPDIPDPPQTWSLKKTIQSAIPNSNIISFRILDEGYKKNGNKHPQGEYSIEAIIQK
jgi:ubiquinone/menaquinone biosynthesis C-methylase UbiE